MQSVLVEAIRNVQKHARADGRRRLGRRGPTRTLVLEITNDGALERSGAGRPGMGLRLAGLEALQYGGLLEFGPEPEGRWQVRLAVPDG